MEDSNGIPGEDIGMIICFWREEIALTLVAGGFTLWLIKFESYRKATERLQKSYRKAAGL